MKAGALKWVGGLAMAAGCVFAGAAQDDATDASVEWRCWWDGATELACAPKDARAASLSRALMAATAGERPASRQQWVYIPMFDYPFDTDSMAVLAQAVMCGGRSQCRVRFSRDVPGAAELQPIAEPLLASVD